MRRLIWGRLGVARDIRFLSFLSCFSRRFSPIYTPYLCPLYLARRESVRFASVRSRVRIPPSPPNKRDHPSGWSFLFGSGGIRIMSAHACGMYMSQCEHWRIPLFLFAVPRKAKRNARESLRHVRRTQLHSVSAVCERAAKTAYPLSPSSFSKSDPLRWALIWGCHLSCKGYT